MNAKNNNRNGNKIWAIMGPLVAALLLAAAGLIFSAINQRVSRLESLLDEIVPTLYRIEAKLNAHIE